MTLVFEVTILGLVVRVRGLGFRVWGRGFRGWVAVENTWCDGQLKLYIYTYVHVPT